MVPLTIDDYLDFFNDNKVIAAVEQYGVPRFVGLHAQAYLSLLEREEAPTKAMLPKTVIDTLDNAIITVLGYQAEGMYLDRHVGNVPIPASPDIRQSVYRGARSLADAISGYDLAGEDDLVLTSRQMGEAKHVLEAAMRIREAAGSPAERSSKLLEGLAADHATHYLMVDAYNGEVLHAGLFEDQPLFGVLSLRADFSPDGEIEGLYHDSMDIRHLEGLYQRCWDTLSQIVPKYHELR